LNVYKSKICLGCGVYYTPTGGRQKYCPQCGKKYRKEYLKEWWKNNRARAHQYWAKYREIHREILRIRQKEADKNSKRKKQKLESVRRWRERHREEHRKRNKEWRRRNREKVNFMNRRREHQLRGAVGSFTYSEWERLKEKYNYTCPSCGRREPKIKLTIDHIIPISKGGTNYISNIQPLCQECNSKKYTRVIRYA